MTYSSRDAVGRVLLAFLKLGAEGAAAGVEEVAEEALVSEGVASRVLGELERREAAQARIEAALKALELGVEPERVARYLGWREFEALAAEAFERAGYEVVGNVRFKALGKRHQVDLLARKGNVILLIDCKHWAKPPTPSEEKTIAEEQERRLTALRDALRKIGGLEEPIKVLLIPLALTLYQPSKMEFKGHLFAPVSRLRGLLEYLETAYFRLRHEKALIPRGLNLDALVEEISKKC